MLHTNYMLFKFVYLLPFVTVLIFFMRLVAIGIGFGSFRTKFAGSVVLFKLLNAAKEGWLEIGMNKFMKWTLTKNV